MTVFLGEYRDVWQIPLVLKAWCRSSVYASLGLLKQEWSREEWGGGGARGKKKPHTPAFKISL